MHHDSNRTNEVAFWGQPFLFCPFSSPTLVCYNVRFSTKEGECEMATRKEKVELNRLLMKLDGMRDVVLCLLSGTGKWDDGTGKGKMVFQSDKCEISDVRVFKRHDWSDNYSLRIGDSRIVYEITDEELVEVLNNGVKRVKEQKLKAKSKDDEERQKKSKITNMDVFKRVADFLTKNGYHITTPKDENAEIIMKCGTVKLWWHNLKDFVSADYGEHGDWDRDGYISIFKVISYWRHKYYKLCYPSLRKLVDKVGVLADVDEQAKVPVAVMDELNRLKI